MKGGDILPNMISDVNYYEILELSRAATQDEVKAAYKKMASVVHPDRGGSAMLFRLVQEAYDVLSDPVKRKQHDSDLAGPSGGNRQAGTQQPQNQSSSSEANYVRVEDLYKRWKEDRNRVAMPRAESSAAGGIRKMIRETVPFAFSGQHVGGFDNGFCSNCGYDEVFKIKRLNPIQLENHLTKEVFNAGQDLGVCKRCNQNFGVFREIKWSFTEEKWLSEKVEVDSGDLIWFVNLKLMGFVTSRAVFGYVVEGNARNEFGLRNLKVLDEFSGQLLTPNNWATVMGHWKSNDPSKNRTGSMRNWSI